MVFRPYDVCLTFAADRRSYARAVHAALESSGVRCFFDEAEQTTLWGTDLVERFDAIFRTKAAFCVALITSEWVEKTWPVHERRSALARALEEDGYFLPVRFDDTVVPGLRPTIAYVDGNTLPPEALARLIKTKTTARPRTDYLPPYPNRLFAALELEADDDRGRFEARSQAAHFISALRELTMVERSLVINVLRFGCPCDLPESSHIRVAKLHRKIESDHRTLDRTVKELNALPGFTCLIETEVGELPHLVLRLSWQDMTPSAPGRKGTGIAAALIAEAGTNICDVCFEGALDRLDFSRTSSELDDDQTDCSDAELAHCHPALEPLATIAADAGWVVEVSADQLRLLAPESRDYVFASLLFLDDPRVEAHQVETLTARLSAAGLDVEAKATAT